MAAVASVVIDCLRVVVVTFESFGELVNEMKFLARYTGLVFLMIALGCSKEYASIHHAARAGDVKGVKQQLAKGVDVNQASTQGWTAVHEAATYGHADVLLVLLANGANPDTRTSNGISALEKAIASEDFECVDILLKAGADYWTPGSSGRSVQELLIALGRANLIPAKK